VEIVDVSNSGKTCFPLPDYPVAVDAPAATYFQGKIVSCSYSNDGRCFELASGAPSWTETLPIPTGFVERASVADNKIVFSGGLALGEGQKLVFYYDDQGIFTPGPNIPVEMHDHCQVTINETHVFLGSYPTHSALLLNVRTDQYTFLEDIPDRISSPACGLLNGIYGKEILIAGTFYSLIFNVNDMIWRNGPELPEYLDYMSYAQVSGGFLAIGGEGVRDDINFFYATDTVYKFDETIYQWTLLPERLELRRELPGAVSVPEEFLNCQ